MYIRIAHEKPASDNSHRTENNKIQQTQIYVVAARKSQRLRVVFGFAAPAAKNE